MPYTVLTSVKFRELCEAIALFALDVSLLNLVIIPLLVAKKYDVLRRLRKEQYLITTFDSSRPFQNRPIARSLLNRLVNIWIAAPNYLCHAGAHNLERAASM